MPDNLDLGWYDIQLFRDNLTDLGQGSTIVRTDLFLCG
jgi:hypothetical protein